MESWCVFFNKKIGMGIEYLNLEFITLCMKTRWIVDRQPMSIFFIYAFFLF